MTLTEQAIATIAAGCEGHVRTYTLCSLDPATVLALCALAQEALQSRREGQQMREATIEECAKVADDHDAMDGTGPSCLGCGEFIADRIRALSHPKPESVK